MKIIISPLTGLPDFVGSSGSGIYWGTIVGDIENQTDLMNLLNNNLVELRYDANNNLIETRELITLANYTVVNLTKGS